MERTAEYCLTQIFHYLVNGLAAIVFFCCIAYSGYALWDNWSILKEPDQVREDLIRYKPANEEELSYSFQELKAMNPDVCGWLTLDHTKIDYPVVQGTDNFEYLEKDVLGNPSVAGSIFLDAKSDRNFHDFFQLACPLRRFGKTGKSAALPKASLHEKDFPRPGQILPAPGRNVTAGDKERSRCHASDKKGSSGIA